MTRAFTEIANGKKLARNEIPHLSFDDFHSSALDIVKNGGKVVHYFAYEEKSSIKLTNRN